MPLSIVRDKEKLKAYLFQNPYLNALAIGDLDDFFWPFTNWYVLESGQKIEQLALFYEGAGLPVLLCFEDGCEVVTQAFVNELIPMLPEVFYAHFHPGLEALFADQYGLDAHGLHHKMALLHPEKLENADHSGTRQCQLADMPLLEELYATAYPDNFFDPRMLETGHYYAIEEEGCFVSAAGIHVFSEQYQIAGIGNVTTLPTRRGEGLAKRVCARLSLELLKRVKYVTLNVKAANQPAIAAYQRLGFEWVADYGEFSLTRKMKN